MLSRTYPTFYPDGSVKVKYGLAKPKFKDTMEALSRWYAEGFVDSEVFTRCGNATGVLLGDNLGGATYD